MENYLAAKYFANIIANDKFDFKPEFGNGVIGIGREADATKPHNRSQGDNLFEIRPKNPWTGEHQFVLVGHNTNTATSWTTANTPDTTSIQRLRRTWRWDVKGISGNSKEIDIKLYPQDIAKLPPLPEGYTKYGIMLGDHTSNAPNFTGSNTQVIEFTQHHFADSTEFFVSLNIKKGSYFTICAIKPQVQFRTATDFAIEGDVGQDAKTAEIYLNHKPAPTTTYDIYFSFLDGTAQRTFDYEWEESDSPRTISFPNTSGYIPFKIINDVTTVNDLPVEYFTITLTGATNGLTLGPRHTLTYSIYDNDPPPKVSFEMAEYTFAESEGVVNIAVKVIGQELTEPATATVEYVPNSGTATINEDFTLASPQILNFDALNSTAYFTINIIDDAIDEDDEYFELKITNTTGDLGFSDTLIVVAKIYITDNDLPPKVSFITPASEGYRSVSNPLIPVQLSNISAKEILVPFHLLGGTAVNDAIASGGDYAASPAGGTLVFQPGDSLKYLYVDNDNVNHLIVYNNYTFSPGDEKTIIFELDENPVNAEREEFIQHIYTIKDYMEFEWQGLAGVGKKPSNTFIMAPDAAIDGSSIPNLGPTNVTISQPTNNKRPTITTRENGLNNKKLIQFDGTKQHLIPESPTSNKNTSGLSGYIQFGNHFDNKSLFFVIIPEKVNATEPQIIFEAGAQRTGMSIYIIQNKLHFQAWGYQDDQLSNPASQGLWGLNPIDQTGDAYVVYEGLVANTPYVISCHYENNFSQTPSIGGLSMFVNGIKVATYNGDVKRMLSNGGSASIGSVLFQTRFYDTKYFTNTNSGNTIPSKDKNDTSHFFKGKMGDFYYFNEPIINEARIRIIHNYLSAKYNIPLQPSSQVFNLDFANNTPGSALPAFNFETAGVGKIGDAVHGDSQGESEMRVRGVQFKNGLNEAFMVWGNNGESLTNTWPVSSSHLPLGIKERSAKVWRFSSLPANGVEAIEILLKFGNTQNATAFSQNPDFLKLLVSQDSNDFTNAVVYPAQILSGNIAKFSNVVVNNGMYVTLGNTSPIYPLPIELLNFSAQLNKPVVDINWSTASEYNNDYFVVERAGEDLIWKEIVKTPGAGNSNVLLYYREKDRNPINGISYYRLKQVDYDGSYKYSDVVSVINGLSTGGDKMVIYPDPIENQQVFLKLPSRATALSGNITVSDISGKKILTIQSPSNQQLITIDLGKIKPGIYLLTYTNEEFTATQKMIVSF